MGPSNTQGGLLPAFRNKLYKLPFGMFETFRVADDRDGCMEADEEELDDNDLNEGGFAVEAITADEERECPV